MEHPREDVLASCNGEHPGLLATAVTQARPLGWGQMMAWDRGVNFKVRVQDANFGPTLNSPKTLVSHFLPLQVNVSASLGV